MYHEKYFNTPNILIEKFCSSVIKLNILQLPGNVYLREFADFRESPKKKKKKDKTEKKKTKKEQFLPWIEFSDECDVYIIVMLKSSGFLSETIN